MIDVKLMKHQADGVEFAVKNGGIAAFFWDVGVGKTLGTLFTYAALKAKTPELKMLVICPISLIYGAWTREIEKFTNFTWHELHGEKNNLPKYVPKEKADIFIVNYEYLIGQKKYDDLTAFVMKHTWLCVLDESSFIRTHDAKRTDRILKIKNLFRHRLILSGTPAPNIEWEYWSQMSFLNDSILGNNFYGFKNRYFVLRRGNTIMPGKFLNSKALRKMHEQGFKYEISPQKREELFHKMKPWSMMVKAKDCLDLPEELDEFRVIEMEPEQKRIYKEMRQHYIAELKGSGGDIQSYAIANIVLTKLLRLRQITSGFVTDDKDVATPICKTNPKIQALREIIEETGKEQLIIWCQFHWEMDAVRDALKDYDVGISELHARIAFKDRDDQLNKFLNGTNRFMIAHPRSAAHGLTMVNCHIQVFFSLNASYEEYSQARGRIYRHGQKNNCLYFHLITKEPSFKEPTIDESVLAIVQGKDTIQGFAERCLK